MNATDMKQYDISVLTNKNLGNESFVKTLLNDWCNSFSDSLRAEFFDQGEPIRKSFQQHGIESAIRLWVDEGMALYLKRKSRPKYQASIEWFEGEKGLDPKLFPWSCTVGLHQTAGDELAKEFFHFLIAAFEPAFGHLTTYEDHRRKHFITFKDLTGTTEMYEGLNILEGEERLPGVYWNTYFGPWTIEKIGQARFADLPAEIIEPVCGGYLVTAYPSSSEIGTAAAVATENKIANRFGKRHFFDKSLVEICSLKDTLEDAEQIENLIATENAKKKPKD